MRHVSYRLEDFDSKKKIIIPIGFVGENEFTQVNINCHSMFKDHPNAVVTSVVTPPKGDEYPGTVTKDGDIVKWIPTASDLVYDGYGEIQLTFTDGEKIGKTYSARTHIEPSAAGSGEVPTPIQTWIEQANEKLAGVESAIEAANGAADEIDNMTVSATGSAYGSDPTATVTEVEEHKHIALTIPAGQPGANGQDGHTPVKGTDYWTEQDKQGIVSDVVTELIDDTTPAADKVFSSSKVDQELTDVKNAIQGVDDEMDDAVFFEETQDDDSIEGIIESEIKDNMTFGLSGTTLSIKYKGDTVCSVQLPTAQPIPCTGVALDLSVATVETEKNVTLTATLTPNNTTDAVTWGSSDDTVASVSNGVVTGVAKGTATITVTCGSFSDTCTVTVTAYFRDLVLGYVLPQSNRLDYRSSYGYKSGGTFNDPFLKKIASGQKVSLKYTPNIISGLYVYMYTYTSGTFTDKCSKVGDDYVLTQAMLDMQSNDTYGILVSSERLASYGQYASMWEGDFTAAQDCFVAFFYNINGVNDISDRLDDIKNAIRIEVE